MLKSIQKTFGCDIRSLALFRLALAFLVIYDALDRFPHAEAFYSDQGFFSSEFSREESPYGFSLNYLSGDPGFQRLLFGCLVTCGVLLAIGFQTRLSALACWLLLVSIHVRNPFVLIGGDTLIRMMLFWSLFIPLGSYGSVDRWWSQRRLKSKTGDTGSRETGYWLCSAGTACLLLQVCIMYWCAGFSKMTEPWWNGTAMEYVLRLEIYVRPFGEWALNQAWLLKTITYSTLAVELLTPFLLLIPFWQTRFRLAAILVFWGLHIGIELAMDVGNFGLVSMVAWLPFIPAEVWNVIGGKKETVNLPVAPSSRDGFARWIQAGGSAIAWLFLGYILIWNYCGMYVLAGSRWKPDLPKPFFIPGWSTMVCQNFQMFGDPPAENPWYVFNGRLKNGSEVDLLSGREARDSRPGNIHSPDVTGEWKKIHRFLLRHRGHDRFHQALLEYYTHKWNRNHPEQDQVIESRLEYYCEDIGPGFVKGDYRRPPDLAHWKSPTPETTSEDELIDGIDSFLKGLQQGPLVPFED